MKFRSHIKTVALMVCILLAFAFNYYEVKHLEGAIGELSTQVEGINDSVEHLSEELDNVNRDLKIKESKISALANITRTNAKNIQSLNSSLSQIITMQNSIEDISMRISTLSSKMAELDMKVYNINNVINSHLVPPATEREVYTNGTAIDSEIIVSLFKKSGLVSQKTVYEFTDLIKVAPRIEKKELVEEIINWTGVADTPYAIEKHDCDDYAYQLYAEVKAHYPLLAFGVAHSKTHTFNFIIFSESSELKIYLIEPQTGNVFSIENATEPYLPIVFVLM